jgi:hypothetical protein
MIVQHYHQTTEYSSKINMIEGNDRSNQTSALGSCAGLCSIASFVAEIARHLNAAVRVRKRVADGRKPSGTGISITL